MRTVESNKIVQWKTKTVSSVMDSHNTLKGRVCESCSKKVPAISYADSCPECAGNLVKE
jgi:hypothetical protein